MTIIDPSLILLARLRFRAWLRRISRGFSSKRGIAFFIIGCVMLLMWLLPTVISAITGSDLGRPHATPERVRDVMPLILLGITLMMTVISGGKVVSFSAAEIDFLFAGPYSRHQLVLWKIAISGFAALWVALVFSIWQMRNASLWIAAFLGIWLAWMFVQSVAMVLLLARQALTQRRTSAVVRIALFALLALVLLAILDILRPLLPMVSGGAFSFDAVLAHTNQSLPARTLLAPFRVLTLTFTSERVFPDLAMWAGASIAMITAILWLILRLDSTFIETSLRASEEVQAIVQRVKRSGNPFGGASKPIKALRVPMLPWLHGCGPVLWRQMMLALRGARGILFIMLLLALGIGPFLWIVSDKTSAVVPMLIVGGFWMLFLLPSMLRFDFRSDLAHMENLKLLPIAPWAVAVGQVMAPALALTLLAGILIAALMALSPLALAPGAAALAFLPSLTFLLVAIENAAFLMFPTSQTMSTPGDMTMMGRTMVIFTLKALAMVLILGAVTGIGGLALIASESWIIAAAVAWVVLTGAALAMIPLVARLFATFDPSVDKPSE